MCSILHQEPRIYTVDDVLSAEEAAHFIDLAQSQLRRAYVSGADSGYISGGRTGKNCWIAHNKTGTTLHVARKIADIVKMPLGNAESFQVIYYEKGQQYYNHLDGWAHDDSEKSRRCLARGGQRMITALVYLNNVESGGETRFTKLNLSVKPRLGKLLVFHNCYAGTNTVHPLTEHTGCPVIAGEKYAFNLWFREEVFATEIGESRPLATEKGESRPLATEIGESRPLATEKGESRPIATDIGDMTVPVTVLPAIVTEPIDATGLVNISKVANRQVYWLTDVPGWIGKFTETVLFNREKPQLVVYPANSCHREFHDAYELDKEPGATYVRRLGQRMWTAMIVLEGSCNIKFKGLAADYNLHKNDVILIKNTIGNTIKRDERVRKTISNTEPCKVVYLWFRGPPEGNDGAQGTQGTAVRDYNGTVLHPFLSRFYEYVNMHQKAPPPVEDGITYALYSPQNFTVELVKALQENPAPTRVIETVDGDCNVYHIANVLPLPVLDIVRRYVRYGIDNRIFPLGDRQSNRYKIRDDIVSRIVQHYVHPVVQSAVNREIVPTYTYLSAYVDEAELPPHTDNPDCEFTVSFVIYKNPDDLYYPVYVHKPQQPVKYRGRYPDCPPKEESIEIDCPINHAMIFSGIDHIHWREKLVGEYTTLLLHFR